MPSSSPAGDPYGASARVRFRRALVLMLMTLVIPGSAQLVAGRRDLGRLAMRIWLGVLAAIVLLLLLGLFFHTFVFWFFTSTAVLTLLRFGLMVAAVGWALLFLDAWRLGDPPRLLQRQRLAMTTLNGVLTLGVAGALLFASHIVSVQGDFISSMFGGQRVSDAHDGRYNVLLLGGDSGADRWGLRPDSITVASIDENTGQTILFGLPRNMLNFPFAKGSTLARQFPHGYDCGDTCELNSLATYAGDHRSLFKGVANPAVAATTQAVEGITGLKMNYYAMVNLRGFRNLVDAVGGVKLHVRDAIPIGGVGAPITGYIKPGYRKLNGFQTLWFARSRVAADDYSRMARQKCVMSAMLQQVSPQTVISHFEAIAKASKSLVTTNLPASELDTFAQLALAARSKPMRTVSFVPPLIATNHPDVARIQSMVKRAIDRSEHPARRRPKPAGSPTLTGGSYGNMSQGYAANQSDDLGSSC